MRSSRGGRDLGRLSGPVGLACLALLPVMLGARTYLLQTLTHALLFATLALSWGILRFSGPVSFGHAAFFGTGAYAAALAATALGLSPWSGLALALLVSLLVALLFGLMALDLRGPYFSLASLAGAEVLRSLALNWVSLTNGPAGVVGIPSLPRLPLPWPVGGPSSADYYVILALLLIVLAAAAGLRRSRFGLAQKAAREGERPARALGVPVFRAQLLALLTSGGAAGLCGACYAHLVQYLEPSLAFNVMLSATPMVMAMVGGPLTLLGPVAGGLALYTLNELVLVRITTAAHGLLYGVAIMAIVLLLPRGLADLLRGPGVPWRSWQSTT
ncbi:MAG: branched-chain amino acid ABC transporter permease [Deltaproteobacteria bacterium]|nr:branched-chain amino acid ABC transporter permease [Deltaproteobacteria bacterium]